MELSIDSITTTSFVRTSGVLDGDSGPPVLRSAIVEDGGYVSSVGEIQGVTTAILDHVHGGARNGVIGAARGVEEVAEPLVEMDDVDVLSVVDANGVGVADVEHGIENVGAGGAVLDSVEGGPAWGNVRLWWVRTRHQRDQSDEHQSRRQHQDTDLRHRFLSVNTCR